MIKFGDDPESRSPNLAVDQIEGGRKLPQRVDQPVLSSGPKVREMASEMGHRMPNASHGCSKTDLYRSMADQIL
jgi:hypothetical protein